MATIDMATFLGDARHQSRNGNVKVPYLIEVELDLAAAVTAKGSALASSDVIQVIDIPAGSVVLFGGFEVTTAMTGTSTDATLDFGVTGGDVDNLVDGFDLDGAAAGAYAASGVQEPVVLAASDTLDLLIVTQTGTILTGVLRCFALVADVSAAKRPGRAALGS